MEIASCGSKGLMAKKGLHYTNIYSVADPKSSDGMAQ